MRYTVFACSVVALLIAVSSVNLCVLSARLEALGAQLDTAERAAQSGEWREAIGLAADAEARWLRHLGYYKTFVVHNPVEAVSLSLSLMRRYAELGDAAGFLTECDRVRAALTSILDMQYPTFANIM